MADATTPAALARRIIDTLISRPSSTVPEWVTDDDAERQVMAARCQRLIVEGRGWLEAERTAKGEWLAARLALDTMPRPPWLASGLSDQQRGELWCREHGKRPYHWQPRYGPAPCWCWNGDAESHLPNGASKLWPSDTALMFDTEGDAFAAVGAAVRAAADVAMGEGWDK